MYPLIRTLHCQHKGCHCAPAQTPLRHFYLLALTQRGTRPLRSDSSSIATGRFGCATSTGLRWRGGIAGPLGRSGGQCPVPEGVGLRRIPMARKGRQAPGSGPAGLGGAYGPGMAMGRAGASGIRLCGLECPALPSGTPEFHGPFSIKD